jgi:hypothetical protein
MAAFAKSWRQGVRVIEDSRETRVASWDDKGREGGRQRLICRNRGPVYGGGSGSAVLVDRLMLSLLIPSQDPPDA